MISLATPIGYARDDDTQLASHLAARGNQRRLRVFLIVFVSVLVAGLAFTFARPAEYRAQARIAVRTGAMVTDLPSTGTRAIAAAVTTGSTGGNASSLEAEAGRLASRPLIEAALAVLQQQGNDMSEFGGDPVQGVQSRLTAVPLPESNLIDVSAIGGQPRLLAALVNALVAAYAAEVVDSYGDSTAMETAALRKDLEELNLRIAQKRNALEDFRETADIVSGDRSENQILARVKGLSASLNVANQKVAEAEGRVRSLRESLAAGKVVVRARDNPSLASLESRASEIRASLREQERSYTPQFMDMDQNTRAARSRLAELEAQIAEQRASSGRVSLAEAEDELATARESQRKLQAQIAEDRAAVHAFSRKFSTFESMQAELAQIEASRSNLSERLLRTETSEASRRPSVVVVESASVPVNVWRPDYGRDAGISVAVAFAVGLIAMALVEVFNRPPRPSMAPMILPQSWIAMGNTFQPSLAGSPALDSLVGSVASSAGRLPGVPEPARELSQTEVARLLQMLRPGDAAWVSLLLCGATLDEIRGLVATDLDAASATIQLQGPCVRALDVPPAVFDLLAATAKDANGQGVAVIEMPESDEELKRRLICAAHDAGLEDPAGLTPQSLRHTCIAWMVRQGLRFGDLERVVGALPADVLAAYAGLSPSGVRRSIGEVATLMPALDSLGGSGAS